MQYSVLGTHDVQAPPQVGTRNQRDQYLYNKDHSQISSISKIRFWSKASYEEHRGLGIILHFSYFVCPKSVFA